LLHERAIPWSLKWPTIRGKHRLGRCDLSKALPRPGGDRLTRCKVSAFLSRSQAGLTLARHRHHCLGPRSLVHADPRVSFKVPHNVEGASGDGRERKSGRRSSERAGRASKIRASEQHSIKHVAGLSLGKTTWSVSPLIIGGCLSDARGPRYAGQ
jgi:hypothetical protein